MSGSPDQFVEQTATGNVRTDDGGDMTAEWLVAEHYADVYRFAYRLAGTATDADDLTQQTFLTACRKLHQIRELTKARSWLFTIARNAYIKSRKAEAVLTSTFEDGLQPVDEPDQLNLEFDEEALRQVLAEMPESYRTPILLFYFEDIGYREIAELLEVPIGTVMSRLSRGKQYLRSRLSSPDGT